MSIESMAIALHHSKARGTDKLVLLGIANHDGDGGAYPSHATLARYANCSVTRVKTAVKRLVELGEIEVFVKAGGDQSLRNDRRPNKYLVLLGCPDDCDKSKQHRVTTGTGVAVVDGNDSQKSDARQSHGLPHDSHTGDYKPSINHPEEPSDAQRICDKWWQSYKERNNGRTPTGARAWFVLQSVVNAALKSGWTADEINTAMDKMTAIPSAGMLDRALTQLPKPVKRAKSPCPKCRNTGVTVEWRDGVLAEGICSFCNGSR